MRRSSGINRAKRVLQQAVESLESRRLLSTTLYSTNFESDSGGFTLSPATSNLWHVSNLASQSGVKSMYYGQESTINYDTGVTNSGSIVSQSISLVGHSAASLRFRYYCYTDNVEDIAEVDITTNGGTSWTRLAANEDATLVDGPQWNLFTASLNSYVGNTVQLRFKFDTVDSIGNDYTGWFVDDVVVADPGSDPAPEITAIAPDYGSTITSASTTISVTFSEAVTGVDKSDLLLSGVAGAGATVTGVTAVGNTYNFAVSGLTSGVLSASIAQPGNATPIVDSSSQAVLPAIQKFIVLLPDQYETNDTFATAANLGRIGNVASFNNMTLHTDTDVDYYKFTPDASGSVTVTINAPWLAGDVDLYVYDGSQSLVGSSATFNDTETVNFTGTAGQTYYIKALSPVGDTVYDYDMQVTAPFAPPTVTGVYVKGSTWSSTYLSYLGANISGSDATYGYGIPAGSGALQLQTLPWSSINTISVKFSEDVTVTSGALSVVGVVSTYNVGTATFSYNSTDHVATWTNLPIGRDKVYIQLDGTTASRIVDLANIGLDGNWSNPTSMSSTGTNVFPSGDGTIGGDFVFRFDVLPGDANVSGETDSNKAVNIGDVNLVKSQSGKAFSTTNFRLNINGDAGINIGDINYVKSKSGTTLPSSGPTLPSSPASGLLTAQSVFADTLVLSPEANLLS